MPETTETTGKDRKRSAPYKIWKNPCCSDDPIQYLGEFYPPGDRPFFLAKDLVELGFGPGKYTVRAPDDRRFARLIPKWHSVRVSG